MLQHYDKARQRLLEIRARDERKLRLATHQGLDPEELGMDEQEILIPKVPDVDSKHKSTNDISTINPKKTSNKANDMISFEEKNDDDDIF